jgi:accessory secretory protein Asp3
MSQEKWIIYWDEYASDTYLYGSQVDFIARDHVSFINSLMPSGTIIKEWFSKTNYQKQRIEPSLPMIDGEGRYRLTVNIDCPDDQNWLIRIVFFDRYDTEVDSMIIRDKETDFKCSLRTYSYSIQLINGGMDRFDFHSMVITELEK